MQESPAATGHFIHAFVVRLLTIVALRPALGVWLSTFTKTQFAGMPAALKFSAASCAFALQSQGSGQQVVLIKLFSFWYII